MEPPELTSAKFKLWRWLLLLSVITAALGGYVWWKSRSERLQFVEPIWSDSLAGHEKSSVVMGQRRKIGEVWSVTRAGGFALFGRGQSCDFAGQYPIFTPANPFQQAVSDKCLTAMLDAARLQTGFHWTEWWGWSRWWGSVRDPSQGRRETINVSCDVLLVSDRAISLREEISRYEDGTRTIRGSNLRNYYMGQDGDLQEVQVEELFRGTEWPEVIADYCRSDLRRQGVEFKGGVGEKVDGTPKVRSFTILVSKNNFAMMPDGLGCYFQSWMLEPDSGVEFMVLIPWERLRNHLRPDGPHRLFQKNVSE